MPDVILNDDEVRALRNVIAGAQGGLNYHAKDKESPAGVRQEDQEASDRLGLVLDDLLARQYGRS